MIQIRFATVEDVNSIFELANACASRGFMLPRSKYKIVTMLQCFMIAEDLAAASLVGCGALNLLPEKTTSFGGGHSKALP